MTLISRASLAMRIRAANISGFTECKKASGRIILIYIARVAGISLRKRTTAQHKMLLMAERIHDGWKRTGVFSAKFTGDHGDRFPSRQLPVRRCISGSQLTIIASYRGVATWNWYQRRDPTRFGSFDATRFTRTQIRFRLCSTCANKVTSCRYCCSFGPHTHRDRFQLTMSRATNFE